MTEPFQFADTLGIYVSRSAYTSGQLAGLADLPRTTIVNWLNGRVQRPRDWQPIVKLLTVLHLQESEADEVLRAARQPTISELRLIASLEQDQALLAGWQRPGPHPALSYRPPFQAVADTPYFVGRQSILAELKKSLLSTTERSICTLQGMAGTGKTAVAARLAYQLRSDFPDGVLWARLDISETMMILYAFAQAYGADLSQYDDVASRSLAVRDILADKRVLIVLDNALDSASVEPLLPPTGQCAVLITTRRHDLRAAHGGDRFSLLPFKADNQASQQLFTHFLGPDRAEAEARPLAEIAACVGHLPLALSIVAGRLAFEPDWSAVDFLERLRQAAEPLNELQSEDQNIRPSFDTSYGLVPAEVGSFFATLSRFGGKDFSPDAAAAASKLPLPDARDYLRILYRLSLVLSSRAGRYQLHPLLSDYARERLVEPVEWTPLANYYIEFLAQHDPGDSELTAESDTILGVISSAQKNGETTVSVVLTLAFAPFLKMQGMYQVAQRYLLKAHEVATGERQLPILLHLSQIARFYRHYEEADNYLVTAVKLAGEQQDIYYQSAIETEKGIIAGCRSDYHGARSHFQEGLALARQHNRPAMLIPILKELGAAEVPFGNYDKSEGHYEEALILARQATPANVPMLLRCLGSIAIIRDQDFGRAGALYEEALDIARAMNSREDIIYLLNNLAVTASQLGRMGEVRELLLEGLKLARVLFHQGGVGMLLSNLGRLALLEQKWEEAEYYLLEALAVATTAQHNQMMTAVSGLLELLDNGPEDQTFERLKIIYD